MMRANNTWRGILLITLFIISILSFFFIDPISQDLAYHNFADTRKRWGITNFFDVISNIPFVFVGIIGLSYVINHWYKEVSWSWLILFLSILLVAVGSSYYHLNPSNETLTWDRLPMAIGFMALLVKVLGDYISPRLEHWLLIPMCLLGISSVIYWHMTDDLRIYAWVQFFSLTLLIVVILIYNSNTFRTKYIFYALGFYALSKIAEYFDTAIFSLTQEVMSGHTSKHLLAAIGTFYFYKVIKHRKVQTVL